MDKINNVHDKLFSKTFGDPENVRDFLKSALPEPIGNAIDLSQIEIDNTHYVSNEFADSFSDIIAKTKMKPNADGESEIDTDIYILFEHKSYRDTAVFIQLLRYMYLMWQKDIDEKRPLRVIIPLVFYHGSEQWTAPHFFIEQFNVPEGIKDFLMDFRYILFDTVNWNFMSEKNKALGENVFLLSALALMKCAFRDDWDAIREIFKFWHEKGFTRNLEKMMLFLVYITETKDVNPEILKKILEEAKIEGGKIMPTLAQRWKDEGRKEGIEMGMLKGMNTGMKTGMKEGMKSGMKAERLKTAKRMLNDNLSIEAIAKYTNLTEKEVRALMH
jgi:predicted transposase/invertase (TIGR01784 family)